MVQERDGDSWEPAPVAQLWQQVQRLLVLLVPKASPALQKQPRQAALCVRSVCIAMSWTRASVYACRISA